MLGTDATPGLDPEEMEVVGGTALGDPVLARTPDGKLWITWTEMVGDDERIFLRGLDPATGEWSETVDVNHDQDPEGVHNPELIPEGVGTLAYHPTLVTVGDDLLAAWTAQVDRVRQPIHRAISVAGGAPSLGAANFDTISKELFRTTLTPLGRGALLVWEAKYAGKDSGSEIEGVELSDDGHLLTPKIGLSEMPDRDCRRPATATSPDGKEIALAFDAMTNEGGHQIFVRRMAVGDTGSGTMRQFSLGELTQITNHPASDIAPALAYSHDGKWLWIGWHSNRSFTQDNAWDIPRWYRLAAMNTETGELFEPPTPPRDRDTEKRETDQGWEFVRLVACPDGGVWVIGRPSHNWCLQKYHGGEWSPIYRLPVDSWGGRGKLASALLDDDGAMWVARRDIRAVALTRMGGAVSDDVREPVLRPMNEPVGRTLINIEPRPEFPSEFEGEEPPDDPTAAQPLHTYFGDIHGHTYMSDGMNDVDEQFLRTRDLHQDDFFALTDHDNFVGQRFLNSEYEEHKRIVEHFHEDGRFVTLYAQEWTTPRASSEHGYGHLCFYSKTPDHPMMDHMDDRWRDQHQIMEVCKQHGMIGGPHHIGWTGHRWEEHDPEVIRFIEVCSVHGVFEYHRNEPIPHRGNFPGCFIQDGLAMGHKFGFVGSTDQHGLIWHHRISWKRDAYRAGITGVLAPELTRDAIFDALKNRRTFATTGFKMRMGFKINGALMGSEITSDGPPRIHVDLVVPHTDIKWVDVVRNNETFHRHGGESLHTFFQLTDEDCPVGRENWYYLRVILDDNNMAWSSPIWVTRTA
jgi:hypothetical protein